jgi:hypothetical protein
MKRLTPSLRWIAVLSVFAGVSIFLTACSEDYTALVSSNGDQTGQPEFRYPELTPEMLAAGPAPGYRIVPLPSEQLDACDTARASAFCHWDHSRNIVIGRFVQLTYFSGLMNSDTTLSIVALNRCVPVADFYPHSMQFSGSVRMEFKIHEMGYDRIVDPATLVVLYYHEDAGEYEPVPFTWEGNYHCMIVYTDHFSRYIIGQRR